MQNANTLNGDDLTVAEVLVYEERIAFYNEERPHQSLANQTPDAVYQTASGGGAMILEKYGDSLPETSDPLRSSDVSGSIVKDVKATATTEVKTGQRRAAASELEPTA